MKVIDIFDANELLERGLVNKLNINRVLIPIDKVGMREIEGGYLPRYFFEKDGKVVATANKQEVVMMVDEKVWDIDKSAKFKRNIVVIKNGGF